jgi:MFS family permease
VTASGTLFASFLFCHLYVTDVPLLPRETKTSGRLTIDKRIIIGWALCFAAQIQLMFLPSVLPRVFEGFRVEQNLALRLAGLVVMFYTVTAMIGTYLWTWLSRRWGVRRVIVFLFISGILLQSMLALSKGIVDFTIMRMIQTGMVAAIIPLVISLFVNEPKGSTIGFLNSARFTGIALGPIIATSILAFSNLTTLYLVISGITLIAFVSFRHFFK